MKSHITASGRPTSRTVYIAYIEVIGLVMCLVLYIPFIIKDWQARRVATPAM